VRVENTAGSRINAGDGTDSVTLGASHGVARLVMVAGDVQGDVVGGFSGAGARGAMC
jgi:hypothetical protein